MTTIPYLHNGELIDLVPKSELDELVAELEQAKREFDEMKHWHERASNFSLQAVAQRDKLRADNAELLERLEERTQSHIHASARDVQTIQRQAVELAKWQALAEGLADALRCISAHDGPGFPHGTCCNIAGQALAAYEATKKGEQP